MRGVDTFLAVKAQSNLTTPIAQNGLATGDFLAFNSESLSGRQQIISNPSIRRQAMQNSAFTAMGTKEASGNLEFTASNFVLDKLLPLIFHTKTGAASTPSSEGPPIVQAGALYSFADGGTLSPFTTFVGFNNATDGSFVRKFHGCKVNTATFSARVDDFLRISLGVVGIGQENEAYTAVPTYHPSADEWAFDFVHASVSLKAGNMDNLVSLPVESFDFNINHNINTNAYRLGSYNRRSLEEGMTDVDGTFTLDLGTKGVGGEKLHTTGSTHQADFLERVAAEARFASIEILLQDTSADKEVGSGPGAEKAQLLLSIPTARLESPNFNVSDTGTLSGSARFVAYNSLTARHISLLAS